MALAVEASCLLCCRWVLHISFFVEHIILLVDLHRAHAVLQCSQGSA